MRLPLLTLATFLCLRAPASETLVVNLNNPTYSKGVVKTCEGGVIKSSDLRIQARKLVYTSTKEVEKVFAEGDLMMEYCGQIFVGERLEFDLKSKTGYLLEGRTKLKAWYMGGHLLTVCGNGEHLVEDAFITTSSNRKNPWKLAAQSAVITDQRNIRAKNVTLRVGKTPLLWLPTYRGNLDRFVDPPIRYRLLYDRGLGPRFSMRWRFLATENFQAFARFDYRFYSKARDDENKPIGPGGALEAEYKSPDGCTQFQTRNYGALDQNFPDEDDATRYRFQGIYKTKSSDEYSRLHLQWDRLSDSGMVGDFRDADFELNTEKATYLEASHYDDSIFGSVTIHPKINPFQSLNQEIPTAAIGLRPFEIFSTGIIAETYATGAYLDYSFSDKTPEAVFISRKAGRFQTSSAIYRPLSLNGLTVTPRAGLVGIFYTDSPQKQASAQLLYTYAADSNFRFSRPYNNFKHTVEPYAHFLGYTKPSLGVDDHFIFDIYDGYDKLNQLRFGVRQLLHSRASPIFLPTLSLDLYGYSFWGAKSFTRRIPKLFADLEFNQPSYAILGGAAWNLQEKLLDYGNIEFLWTLSANLALGVEFRHRSKFYWRKAIHDNFIVDAARSLDELLASPLSDGRNTLLTKAHLHLTPRWNLHFESFHGWGRADEPFYNGARVDLYTMLTGSWQMKLSYEYLPNDEYRFSYSFKLIK